MLWLRQVDEDFHARFSAYSRTYRYRIFNRWIRPALDTQRTCWFRKPLDAELMDVAAQQHAPDGPTKGPREVLAKIIESMQPRVFGGRKGVLGTLYRQALMHRP